MKKRFLYVFFLLQFFANPSYVLAQSTPLTCDAGRGINTAIGCIPKNDTQLLAEFFLRWGMGLAGGFSLLLIIYGGFLVMTASGNPKKAQAGKEVITSAIGGIIFLIFSMFVLRVVGIDILKLQLD